MNNLMKSSQVASLISLAVVLCCVCVPTKRSGNLHAQNGHKSPQAQRLEMEDDSIDSSRYLSPVMTSVSPDLREQLDRQSSGGDFRTMEAKRGALGAPAKDSIVKAIVQLNQQPGNGLSTFPSAASVVERGQYSNFDAKLVELPLSKINASAAFKGVRYISLHRNVEVHGPLLESSGEKHKQKPGA